MGSYVPIKSNLLRPYPGHVMWSLIAWYGGKFDAKRCSPGRAFDILQLITYCFFMFYILLQTLHLIFQLKMAGLIYLHI